MFVLFPCFLDNLSLRIQLALDLLQGPRPQAELACSSSSSQLPCAQTIAEAAAIHEHALFLLHEEHVALLTCVVLHQEPGCEERIALPNWLCLLAVLRALWFSCLAGGFLVEIISTFVPAVLEQLTQEEAVR